MWGHYLDSDLKNIFFLIFKKFKSIYDQWKLNLIWYVMILNIILFSVKMTLLFGHSVVSDSLGSHGLQHARLPCPSASPRARSNSCPLSQWCHISNHLILCRPLLLLPSIFPSISIFSSKLVLLIKWPKWSFSLSISSSNEYSELICLGLTGLISLQSNGFSRVFWNTRVQKHPIFGAQPSLWSNSHIHTWLLEKPQLWLDGPLLAK